MFSEKEIKAAFDRSVNREDRNLNQLAQKTGVPYSVIHNLANGKKTFLRLEFRTLSRLFPEMRVYFFREDYPETDVPVNGSVSGAIANGKRARTEAANIISGSTVKAPVNQITGGVHIGNMFGRKSSDAAEDDQISKQHLTRLILKSGNLSAEDRLKFLNFLDENL